MLKNIEKKIKYIREDNNISRKYMADKLGISVRAYAKIETGETQLTVDRLGKISAVFNLCPLKVINYNAFTNNEKKRDLTLLEVKTLLKKNNEILKKLIEACGNNPPNFQLTKSAKINLGGGFA